MSAVLRGNAHQLRVLSYHDMAPMDEALFERQLLWLQRLWRIVSPATFEAIIDGSAPLECDSALLTFDDGTVSNLHVAQRVLSKLRIQALFFVVASYALLEETDDWRAFAASRICLGRAPADIPDNFRNMSVGELRVLLEQGHTVGAHTLTHARLSTLTGDALRQEIVQGGDVLEHHLGTAVEHFAYPFGDFASLSKEASEIARGRYKYVYTALRGDNGDRPDAGHIRRESNDPHDSLWYTGACLEGGADFLYRARYARVREW